jgi:hypothetical protein
VALEQHRGAAEAVEVDHGARAARGEIASTGVRRQMAWMSCRVNRCRLARQGERWRTPLVEPPMAAMAVMALVKAAAGEDVAGADVAFEEEAHGLADAAAFVRLAASTAGMEEVSGRLRPMASMAMPQVLKEAAMPQPPGPGQAARMMARFPRSSWRHWSALWRLGIVGVEDGGGFALVAAGQDGAAVDDEAG